MPSGQIARQPSITCVVASRLLLARVRLRPAAMHLPPACMFPLCGHPLTRIPPPGCTCLGISEACKWHPRPQSNRTPRRAPPLFRPYTPSSSTRRCPARRTALVHHRCSAHAASALPARRLLAVTTSRQQRAMKADARCQVCLRSSSSRQLPVRARSPVAPLSTARARLQHRHYTHAAPAQHARCMHAAPKTTCAARTPQQRGARLVSRQPSTAPASHQH